MGEELHIARLRKMPYGSPQLVVSDRPCEVLLLKECLQRGEVGDRGPISSILLERQDIVLNVPKRCCCNRRGDLVPRDL